MVTSVEFYKFFSKVYKKKYLEHTSSFEFINKLIIENITNPIENMLDIGTGDGTRAKQLIDNIKPKNYLLIDNSPEMVELCKTQNLNIRLEDITLFQSKIKYDLVTCLWNVLGHISDKEGNLQAINNISKSLKPNGVLVFDINNRHNITNYGAYAVKNIFKDIITRSWSNGNFNTRISVKNKVLETHVHLYSVIEIVKLLQEAHLGVEKIFFVHYFKPYLAKNRFGGQILVIARKPE